MAACFLLLPACFSARYTRVDRGGPLEQAQLDELKVGESSMQQCVDVLGAPLVVREHNDGADLIWGWERNSGFMVSATIPLGDARSANAAYGQRSVGATGWTLRFDSGWNLISKHQGRLTELLALSSPPPKLLEEARQR